MREEKIQGVRQVLEVLLRNFAKGLIPKRYVSSHSVGFVHPHVNHVNFQCNFVLEVEGLEFLMSFLEISFVILIIGVLMNS